MLRDAHRLLRPDGRTAFLTIHPSPGLSAEHRRRAIETGPPGADCPDDLAGLVRAAGFREVDVVDVTGEYRDTQQAWMDQWEAHADHLETLYGAEMVRDRRGERRRTLAAIDEGLLRRSLVTATRP